MRTPRAVLAWIGLLVIGLALIGAGVAFGVARLDVADQWGSVVGALVAILGLPLSVYGIVLARRGTPAPPGGAVVQRVRAGRDAYVSGGDQHFYRGSESDG